MAEAEHRGVFLFVEPGFIVGGRKPRKTMGKKEKLSRDLFSLVMINSKDEADESFSPA